MEEKGKNMINAIQSTNNTNYKPAFGLTRIITDVNGIFKMPQVFTLLPQEEEAYFAQLVKTISRIPVKDVFTNTENKICGELMDETGFTLIRGAAKEAPSLEVTSPNNLGVVIVELDDKTPPEIITCFNNCFNIIRETLVKNSAK
jgi:hypothetical protein